MQGIRTHKNDLDREWLILHMHMPGICACAYLTSVNQALGSAVTLQL